MAFVANYNFLSLFTQSRVCPFGKIYSFVGKRFKAVRISSRFFDTDAGYVRRRTRLKNTGSNDSWAIGIEEGCKITSETSAGQSRYHTNRPEYIKAGCILCWAKTANPILKCHFEFNARKGSNWTTAWCINWGGAHGLYGMGDQGSSYFQIHPIWFGPTCKNPLSPCLNQSSFSFTE